MKTKKTVYGIRYSNHEVPHLYRVKIPIDQDPDELSYFETKSKAVKELTKHAKEVVANCKREIRSYQLLIADQENIIIKTVESLLSVDDLK
jgi:hypothetical protein